MIAGTITAPAEAESDIRAAGFIIFGISWHERCPALRHFMVEGPRSALEAIDDNGRWGEWIWSLEEVNRGF